MIDLCNIEPIFLVATLGSFGAATVMLNTSQAAVAQNSVLLR
jgi:DNA-binding transcriptional LysR family regulator